MSYLAASALLLLLLHLLYLVIHRLFLSPLAKFPGPRLAALSNWYEFYYDVILQGRFTFHIQDLHKKYGPIVRITPTELHIDDPDYFDTLYARAGGRRHKYDYFCHRLGSASSDSFSTADHDHHRLRRKAISPFFAAGRIAAFQPVIRAGLDKLCCKLAEHHRAGYVLDLGRACMALTTDIITEYAFAEPYGHLDSPRFRETMDESVLALNVTGHFSLHFPFVVPILNALPEWFVRATQPAILPFLEFKNGLLKQIRNISNGVNQGHKDASHATIFHELLNSNLSPKEKTEARLADEALLIVGAGLATTAWALTVASFHITNNAHVGARLRSELATVSASADWRDLDKLPYLSGCVFECLRLSHGVTTRDPRLAPDAELTYREWTIPRNTPVSMTTVDVLMNEEIFPNPRSFEPERWLDRPDLQRYFVPFGKGSRQCLGINLAMAELYLTLAAVFSRFELELFETDESDVEMEHAYIVPYPKWTSKGVRARVKTILSHAAA